MRLLLLFSLILSCRLMAKQIKIDYLVQEKDTLPKVYKKFLRKGLRMKSTDTDVRQTLNYNDHVKSWGKLDQNEIITLYIEHKKLSRKRTYGYIDKNINEIRKAKRRLALDQLVFKPLPKQVVFGFYYKLSLDFFNDESTFGSIDFFSSSPFGVGLEASYYDDSMDKWYSFLISPTSPIRFSMDANVYQVLRVENVDAAFDYTIRGYFSKYHFYNLFTFMIGGEYSQLNTVGSAQYGATDIRFEIREHKVLLFDLGLEYDYQIKQFDLIFQAFWGKTLANSYEFVEIGNSGEAAGSRYRLSFELNYINRIFGRVEYDSFTHEDGFNSTINRVLGNVGLRF